MIERRLLNNTITNPYVFVEKVLDEKKDFYLTKEEIYREVDVDEQGTPLITISAVENALRSMVHSRVIDVAYVRGVRYFGINGRRN